VGCVTGDTLINVNRAGRGGKYRIDHIYAMYHKTYIKGWNLAIPTCVRSYDSQEHKIKLHPLKDCVYAGKKKVYLLSLKNGYTLKATAEHKIMTSQGFKELKHLTIHDEVMIDGLLATKKTTKTYKMPDAYIKVPYHPYKKQGRVEAHRLVYEAYQNKMHLKDFLFILWNDPQKAHRLSYIDPQKQAIHHKDGNHYNNYPENLQLVTGTQHKQLHTKENVHNFSQGNPSYVSVESITPLGYAKTYDIICEDPLHTFVANKIVIHNSGKTACAVREIFKDHLRIKTYSNIITSLPQQITISKDKIVKKEIVDYKKNKKTGEDKPIYEETLNIDYWKQLNEPINVILDEAHTILNSRQAMKKQNILVTQWLALIRRVLNQGEGLSGDLTFITQLPNRLDIIARDMATHVRYHICHYRKTCNACGSRFKETSQTPEPLKYCPVCGKPKLIKHSHIIEALHFNSMCSFNAWNIEGMKTYYRRYYIKDIEKYFPLYNTLQWENMFSD